MTAGGRRYFVNAYLSIRVLREHLHCTLPIEVFHLNDELPQEAVDYMESAFSDVDLVNLSQLPDVPPNLDIQGYPVKAFAILMSSFEEVLFLDVDNFPLVDPAGVFELADYLRDGALFWPDNCQYFSSRIEAWDVFGLPRPASWPQFEDGANNKQTDTCSPAEPTEIESGQIVINKRRAWRGLYMTAFVSRFYNAFFRALFANDKNVYQFAFNTTATPFALVAKHPFGIGLEAAGYFCGNSFGQRHPQSGVILFVHRGATKFDWPDLYFEYVRLTYAWTHVATQRAKDSWEIVWIGKESVPSEAMLGIFLPGILAHACSHPRGGDVVVVPVSAAVRALEDVLLRKLRALAELSFLPGRVEDCGAPAKEFFCAH